MPASSTFYSLSCSSAWCGVPLWWACYCLLQLTTHLHVHQLGVEFRHDGPATACYSLLLTFMCISLVWRPVMMGLLLPATACYSPSCASAWCGVPSLWACYCLLQTTPHLHLHLHQLGVESRHDGPATACYICYSPSSASAWCGGPS